MYERVWLADTETVLWKGEGKKKDGITTYSGQLLLTNRRFIWTPNKVISLFGVSSEQIPLSMIQSVSRESRRSGGLLDSLFGGRLRKRLRMVSEDGETRVWIVNNVHEVLYQLEEAKSSLDSTQQSATNEPATRETTTGNHTAPSKCTECGAEFSESPKYCPQCGASVRNAPNPSEREVEHPTSTQDRSATDTAGTETSTRKRTDKYWARLKFSVAVPVTLFVIDFIVYLIRVPTSLDSSEVTFDTYPVYNILVFILALSLLPAIVIFWHSLYRDKQELSKDFADVTRRHWITIAVFSYFSIGLYPLWYLVSRYKRTKDEPTDGGSILAMVSSSVGSVNRPTFRGSPDSEDDDGKLLPSGMASIRSGIDQISTAGGLFGRDTGTTATGADEDGGLPALKQAEKAVAEGDAARSDEEHQRAIDAYETALEIYEQAKSRADTDERKSSLGETVAETQRKLDTVRERKERIDKVRNPVQNAESSFQTAIAEHAQNNLIPARRDYRQARDQYEQALDMLDELEKDVFKKEGEITVSVNLEAEYLPKKLIAWDYLSDDERETLSETGIGTLSDIRNVSDEVIQELVEDGTIEKELANQLRAVKWWHGGEERTFTSSKTIERQRDRAKKGFQMLS